MKNLDEVVIDALDLHGSYELPELRFGTAKKRIVVASGNALPTGRIIFQDEEALYADEGQYEHVLDRNSDVDSAVIISASGKKHSVHLVEAMSSRGLDTYLLTCDANSPAAQKLPEDHVFETRSNKEPITYNTSTYLGMILAKTRENVGKIKDHLLKTVNPMIPDARNYGAFYLIVPPKFDGVREMFITKFDELFGGRVNGRCYTSEQTMHAKTVVPWERELFISLGYENSIFGEKRLNVPLFENAGFAAMIATGYYVVGRIQAQFPPWFKENADAYAAFQEELFQSHK